GPRRPRVPLLLLATGSSFDIFSVQAPGERFRLFLGELGLERPAEGALGQCFVETIAGPADVGAPSGRTTGLIGDHVAAGRAHDAQKLALRTNGPARDARSVRDAARRDRADGRGYDATSPEGTAAAAFLVVL